MQVLKIRSREGEDSKQNKYPVVRPEKVFAVLFSSDLNALAVVNHLKVYDSVNKQQTGGVLRGERVGFCFQFFCFLDCNSVAHCEPP
jgi:hypothetical protein